MPGGLVYPRPEAALTRTDAARIVRELRTAGEIGRCENIQYYDPWYYWQYEYEQNPSAYYRGPNNKFETGIVCTVCDNWRWSRTNKVVGKYCKGCLNAMEESGMTPDQMRRHCQQLMYDARMLEKSPPTRIVIISAAEAVNLPADNK